jgi:hypothetical protein
MGEAEVVLARSVRRLRAKGWSIEDIADRHSISVERVRFILGMEVKHGIFA